uniref:Uncharacterized protein n=1 Tax=Rhizophora mucronata TaxID=61149 RepID=A0A2P2NN14_RHIMU
MENESTEQMKEPLEEVFEDDEVAAEDEELIRDDSGELLMVRDFFLLLKKIPVIPG